MPSLRIILVMVEPPLPFGHAVARWSYVLLKGLEERGHRVTAFAACSSAAEIEEAKDLFRSPGSDLRAFPISAGKSLSDRALSALRPHSYMFSRELRAELAGELSRGFDVLHLESTWTGWLGRNHVRKALINIHNLYEIDLSDRVPTSLLPRLRLARMFRVERALIRKYQNIVTLTSRLTDRVREISASSDVTTVPLGLDLSLYPFRPTRDNAGSPVLGLVGSFHWMPTFSAGERLLTRLWPEIKRRVPAAKLTIVGRNARSAMRPFLSGLDVSIHENVPDILPFFQSMDAIIYAPSRGSGMKVKILEAFALGTPVVTTSEGVEGLPAEDGKHAGICEDDAGLIDRTVRLLTDPVLRDAYRREGRTLVEQHCSPKATVDSIERIHRRIACS
jgi:glycosyltransferase involved in cell wall biosynthesis